MVLIGFSLLAGNLRIQASEVVPWLRGTYTPFVTEGADPVLAEHKGLSPLMGAIAWESGWIKGLYTWGIGEKTVKRVGDAAAAGGASAAEDAGGAGPAEPRAAAGHVKISWSGNDATTELVRTLFHEAGEGDIQPTISDRNPFYKAIKDRERLNGFLDILKTGIIPTKDEGFPVERSKKFFELVARSRSECGEGKKYPAHVTDQILSTYYYAAQRKLRGAADSVEWMCDALERYMHALGVASYVSSRYEEEELCVFYRHDYVDERDLVTMLYEKLTTGIMPPLAVYTSFGYRGSGDKSGCVEVMIRNFFNMLLYDAVLQRYTLELLPQNLRESALPSFITFYSENTAAANTDSQKVHDAWLGVVSGLTVGEPQRQAARSSGYAGDIFYRCKDSAGSFELASSVDNVLLVINTLLGTTVFSFADLGPLLSTPTRKVMLEPRSSGDGFVLSINGQPLIIFCIDRKHSSADYMHYFKRVLPGKVYCLPHERSHSLEQLQYALLTFGNTDVTQQEARYLLYGAGARDYDLLVLMANVYCEPYAEDELFVSAVSKLAQQSPDALRSLNPLFLFKNIKTLLSKGVVYTGKETDLCTKTWLMHAADGGFLEVVRALLNAGTEVNAKGPSGWTALMFAARSGQTAIVQELIAHGALINDADKFGELTALILAVLHDFLEIVQQLLASGARVDLGHLGGQSALDLARKNGNRPIIELLERAEKEQAEKRAQEAAGRAESSSPAPQTATAHV